jgi:hypothetical protein
VPGSDRAQKTGFVPGSRASCLLDIYTHAHLLCSPARVLELSIASIYACSWSRVVVQLSLCSVPATARVLVGVLNSSDRSFSCTHRFPSSDFATHRCPIRVSTRLWSCSSSSPTLCYQFNCRRCCVPRCVLAFDVELLKPPSLARDLVIVRALSRFVSSSEPALTCSTTPRQLAPDSISSSFRTSSRNSKSR